ncbi:unnamed protein product, partial [Cyprideis torosa]
SGGLIDLVGSREPRSRVATTPLTVAVLPNPSEWWAHKPDLRPIKDDEGIYTCVVNDKQSYENRKASRVRLSIISDDPDSELRVYRVDLEASLTRGLIAAGVTAFLVAAICLIYRCRWRPGKNRNVSSYDIAPSQAHLSIIPSEGSLEGFDNIGIRGYDNNGIDISGDHIAQAKTSHIPRYSLEDGPQVSKL